MKAIQSIATRTQRVIAGRSRLGVGALALGCIAFTAILAWSGVTAFHRQTQPVALAAQRPVPTPALGQRPAPVVAIEVPTQSYEVVGSQSDQSMPQAQQPKTTKPAKQAPAPSVTAKTNSDIKRDRLGNIIYVNGKPWTGEVFDYRPIRPVRRQTMKTTAYSPDERSCGKWADGITASGKSVWMNGGRLVAADRKVPYGTILTIPGYNNGKPVQVWDRGGKIKGNRLDLLYPTHNTAKRWGVQDLSVVFWEFVEAD